jgi:hypothetical protein
MKNIKNNTARQFFSKIDYGFLPPSTLIDILRKEDSPKTSDSKDGIIDSETQESETMSSRLKKQSVVKAQEALTSNITEIPTFHKVTVTLPEITHEMRTTLSRLSANACQKALLADSLKERSEEVLCIQDIEKDHKVWKEKQDDTIGYFNSVVLGV